MVSFLYIDKSPSVLSPRIVRRSGAGFVRSDTEWYTSAKLPCHFYRIEVHFLWVSYLMPL